MSLGDWLGERFEYGVRVSGDGIQTYVGSIDHSDAAEHLIGAQAKRHASPGLTVEVVRRTVTYGPWEIER